MKNLLLSLLLFAALPLCAQNARYSIAFSSVTSQYTTPFVVANVAPNLPIPTLCNHPANQVPCTNYATTYTSGDVPCANGTQDTPDPQPSACQATGDAQGNIAFWAAPGEYDYTVCLQNTVTCFGPYTITLSLPDLVGECTMVSGQCPQQTFSYTFRTKPICVVTWTGTGTLTGFLSSQLPALRVSYLQPKSSVNSDTAVIDWKCQGNPN